jgi:hypothetical protein
MVDIVSGGFLRADRVDQYFLFFSQRKITPPTTKESHPD